MILWLLAIFIPGLAHITANWIGRRIGSRPVRALPRVILLTAVSVGTLLWLTGSRFSSVEITDTIARVHYAPPVAREYSIPLEQVSMVALQESTFPRASYSIAIRSNDGSVYESVGVAPVRLQPVYDLYDALRPGETPVIALQR